MSRADHQRTRDQSGSQAFQNARQREPVARQPLSKENNIFSEYTHSPIGFNSNFNNSLTVSIQNPPPNNTHENLEVKNTFGDNYGQLLNPSGPVSKLMSGLVSPNSSNEGEAIDQQQSNHIRSRHGRAAELRPSNYHSNAVASIQSHIQSAQ